MPWGFQIKWFKKWAVGSPMPISGISAFHNFTLLHSVSVPIHHLRNNCNIHNCLAAEQQVLHAISMDHHQLLSIHLLCWLWWYIVEEQLCNFTLLILFSFPRRSIQVLHSWVYSILTISFIWGATGVAPIAYLSSVSQLSYRAIRVGPARYLQVPFSVAANRPPPCCQ